MAQQLQEMPVLPEDPDSVTSTCMAANSSQFSVAVIPGDLVPSSAPKACMWCT